MKRTTSPIRYTFLLLLAPIMITCVTLLMYNVRFTNYGNKSNYKFYKNWKEKEEGEDIYYDVFDGGEASFKPAIKLPNHNQEDSELVRDLVSIMIRPYPANSYYLRLSDFETSRGEGRVIRVLTNYKEGGFFVECGARDGELNSNTLFLEKHLSWTGLLVEANPFYSSSLINVHRRSWVAPACMSLNTSAYESGFQKSTYFLGSALEEPGWSALNITCFPFYSYMLALNVTTIDYFSLDVAGHEVEILQTIPFEKISITVLSVQCSKSRGGLLGVKSEMERNGYKLVMEVASDNLIFVKRNHVIQQRQMLLF